MPQVPTLEVLLPARALVANPKTWTQGIYARLGDQHATTFDDPRATCFCAEGAVIREGSRRGLSDDDLDPLLEALDRIANRLGYGPSLTHANDAHGQLAALFVIDRAIDELSPREVKLSKASRKALNAGLADARAGRVSKWPTP